MWKFCFLISYILWFLWHIIRVWIEHCAGWWYEALFLVCGSTALHFLGCSLIYSEMINILVLADCFCLKMCVLLRLDKLSLHSTDCPWRKESSIPHLSHYKCPWFGSSRIKESAVFLPNGGTGTDFWNVVLKNSL